MSSFAWLIWRVLQCERTRPTAAVFWVATIITAVLIGIGHSPIAAALLPLTAPVIAQVVLLNALAGIVFGWLYWQRCLEAAMVAHAMVHVVFIAGAILRIIRA